MKDTPIIDLDTGILWAPEADEEVKDLMRDLADTVNAKVAGASDAATALLGLFAVAAIRSGETGNAISALGKTMEALLGHAGGAPVKCLILARPEAEPLGPPLAAMEPDAVEASRKAIEAYYRAFAEEMPGPHYAVKAWDLAAGMIAMAALAAVAEAEQSAVSADVLYRMHVSNIAWFALREGPETLFQVQAAMKGAGAGAFDERTVRPC